MIYKTLNLKSIDNPLCSVCISNYNGEDIIDKCIDSVLNQNEYSEQIEIIIHDDASTDNSVKLIKSRYPQIRLLHSSDNVGFCISNNRMVSFARGKYILLLNNDAALWPDALSVLLNKSESQKHKSILTLPQYDWQSREVVDRGCFLDPFYNPVPNLDPTRTEVTMAIGACLWIPKNIWFELGGFPEWIESIAEDLFFCCKARYKGYSVRVTTSSGYWHLQGESFGGNRAESKKLMSTFRRRALSERNKTYVLFLFTPDNLLPILFIVHILLLFSEGIILSAFKKNKRIFLEIYLNVFSSFLKNRRMLFDKRISIQAGRKCSMKYYFRLFTLIPRKIIMLKEYGIPGIR